ncbi:TlyA family RNA methyltransferase [Ponticaulis sp.]|uniref:TlyA family RNA methyltransferase n=1 Tax=Ponticaulis sp. TaxID=2020902 RepID=UPI000C3739E3|nr:TlyA family RNA methyltransferase [Ponticaulis sp.]MBN05918.1 TlyA family rRNA (cytidine-2'-O)-methyltransferase [Ponticaulis sp.]
MSERVRLDKFLVDSGSLATRSDAQAAISAGKVTVNGTVVTKASLKVGEDDIIHAERAHPYVSRAALKLKGALDVFGVDASGLNCLDVGCSTGGFTQVLLEAGAAHVISVDVGTDQFHPSLPEDPRITLYEQLDARKLTSEQIDREIDLLVCDASFIGLEKVLDPAVSFVKPGGLALLLFKPQFQVGRKAVGKGGIVTDIEAVDVAKQAFSDWLVANGFKLKGWEPSPVTGSDGNQEWLVYAIKS